MALYLLDTPLREVRYTSTVSLPDVICVVSVEASSVALDRDHCHREATHSTGLALSDARQGRMIRHELGRSEVRHEGRAHRWTLPANNSATVAICTLGYLLPVSGCRYVPECDAASVMPFVKG
jgi:hypothetical protein